MKRPSRQEEHRNYANYREVSTGVARAVRSASKRTSTRGRLYTAGTQDEWGKFALALMSGWLSKADSSLTELTQAYSNCHEEGLTRQGLDKRFSGRAAHFMERLVHETVGKLLGKGIKRSQQEWLNQFSAVWVCDSTVIRLPDALSPLWGRRMAAA